MSLALQYRPRTFSELTGQRHVAAVLSRCLLAGAIPQQLLFAGGSGLGKTTVARICAAAILCETPLSERPSGDACSACSSCNAITTPGATHPDVIEFDAASHGGKDEIREIASRAALAPLRAERKIYIIDEAHGLSGPGGQAFLKLLEEPPEHVIFMLATTDPDKMAKANRGRCTEFELLRPADDELTANLHRVAQAEGWVLTQAAATAVVEATSPDLGVRGTLMTLEKLAGALRAGQELDETMLSALLGTPLQSSITALTNAIGDNDAAKALVALTTARNESSDSAVRRGLTKWAHDQVTSSTALALPAAVDQLERILAAPPGPMWTDLLVARLASPAYDNDTDALHKALQLVEQTASRICAQPTDNAHSTVGAPGHRTVTAEQAGPSQPYSAGSATDDERIDPVQPDDALSEDEPVTREEPDLTLEDEPHQSDSAQGTQTPIAAVDGAPGAASVDRAASSEVAADDSTPVVVSHSAPPERPTGAAPTVAVSSAVNAERFIDEVSLRSRKLAAVLRGCRIECSDPIVVHAQPGVLKVLNDEVNMRHLQDAAAGLGRSLDVAAT